MKRHQMYGDEKWMNCICLFFLCLFWFKQAVSNLWVASSATNRPNRNVVWQTTKTASYENKFANVLPPNRPNQMRCFEIRFSQMLLALLLPRYFPRRKKEKKQKSRFSIKFETFALKAIAILLHATTKKKQRN